MVFLISGFRRPIQGIVEELDRHLTALLNLCDLFREDNQAVRPDHRLQDAGALVASRDDGVKISGPLDSGPDKMPDSRLLADIFAETSLDGLPKQVYVSHHL